jgi:4'-phosphopantetheinyl transferase
MQAVMVAARTPEVLAAVPEAERLLTDAEDRRAAAFRSDRDRDDFVAAHVLARACAAASLCMPVDRLTWRQRCPDCGGPHGRPTIMEASDLGVSLAHAGGYVAAAAAPGPIGIDIEPVLSCDTNCYPVLDVFTDDELRVFDTAPDRNIAFLRQWVRREALVKVGVITLDTLRNVELSHLPPVEPAHASAEHRWAGFVITDWCLGLALGAVAAHGLTPLRPLTSVLRAADCGEAV